MSAHDGRTDLSAPYPLGHLKAVAQGLELRLADPGLYSYRTLSDLMARYHGFHRSPGWWMTELRKAGVPHVRSAAEIERCRRNCEPARLRMAA